MAEIKGIILNAWMEFLKERFGKKSFTDTIQTLNPEDRSLLQTQILAFKWYPYHIIYSLGKLTYKLSQNERNIFMQIGRFTAKYVFNGAYHILLEKDPIKQVKKFSWIGEVFYKDTRELKYEFFGETKCLVRRDYLPGLTSTVNNCESVIGFWAQTLELSGADNVRASHPKCVAKGANCCEFMFEWELPKSD
jgi:hypothetical protein